MTDTVQLAATDDELLLAAGIAPEVVQMNEGMLTPQVKEALIKKHGPAVANLFEGKMENMRKAARTRAKQAEKERDQVLKDSLPDVEIANPVKLFEGMKAWAQETWPADEYAEMAELMKKGGKAHRLAMKELCEQYVKAGKLEQVPTLVIANKKAGTTAPDYISSEEYVKKLKEYEAAGHQRSSKLIQNLMAQRMRSRKQEQ